MIVAVHAVGVGRAVGHQRVPTLPDGRRAHVHLVQPPGEPVVEKDAPRRLPISVVRERIEQEGRADEPRHHAATVPKDILVEQRRKFCAAFFGDDAEIQGNCLRRDRVEHEPSAFRHIFIPHARKVLLVLSAIELFFFRFPEKRGGICRKL